MVEKPRRRTRLIGVPTNDNASDVPNKLSAGMVKYRANCGTLATIPVARVTGVFSQPLLVGFATPSGWIAGLTEEGQVTLALLFRDTACAGETGDGRRMKKGECQDGR